MIFGDLRRRDIVSLSWYSVCMDFELVGGPGTKNKKL